MHRNRCCYRRLHAPTQRKKYSADRLFALDEYCKTVSRTRVCLVLLLFSTPALMVMLMFELIPLQDPGEGWQANSVYWARTCAGSALICGAILVQIRAVIPEIAFTTTQVVTISVSTSVGHTSSLLLLAKYWKFPIPFTYTLGGLPLMMVMDILVVLTLGTADRARLQKYVWFSKTVGIQTAVLMVYPAYNAMFISLKGESQQLVFVLLLPFIKVCLKYTLKRTTETMNDCEYDDRLTSMSSSVVIFDALYMTKCMQSTGTLVVGFAIVVLDTAQNFTTMRRLVRQTQTLRAVKKYVGTRENGSSGQASPQDVLPWVAGILNKTESCNWLAQRSRKSYVVSAQSQQTLGRMRAIRVQSYTPFAPSYRSVVPIPHELVPITRALTGKTVLKSANKDVVTETVHLLHMSESVVVVEYIEVVVPVVYAIYIVILFHLSNAKYYQDMRNVTVSKLHSIVTSILIYAFMELLSLLYVHYTLKRHFGISVFYQLAFALESEWPTYQTNFLTWILVVFQFLLVHNGADFSFKFDWDAKRNQSS